MKDYFLIVYLKKNSKMRKISILLLVKVFLYIYIYLGNLTSIEVISKPFRSCVSRSFDKDTSKFLIYKRLKSEN